MKLSNAQASLIQEMIAGYILYKDIACGDFYLTNYKQDAFVKVRKSTVNSLSDKDKLAYDGTIGNMEIYKLINK